MAVALTSAGSRAFNPAPREQIYSRAKSFANISQAKHFHDLLDIVSSNWPAKSTDAEAFPFLSLPQRVSAASFLDVVMSRDRWTCDQIIRTPPPPVAAFRFFFAFGL